MTVIDPNSVFTVATAAKALGLSERSIKNAMGSGDLKFSQRARSTFIRGTWLVEWIEAGEVRRGDLGNDEVQLDLERCGIVHRKGFISLADLEAAVAALKPHANEADDD